MTGSLPVAGERAAFHVMTKPIGPICNLDCKYCFYLEKQKLYPGKSNFRMPDEVLERYVRAYIEAQDVPEIAFAWQGGEPTLMGLEFFKRAVEFQKNYADGKRITNAFQTNGTLLDDAWCEFFRVNEFLIGLSIDGPREVHDRYRVDPKGQATFGAVMRGMGFLKKHNVDFNALCVVNRVNSRKPVEVYRFLADEGSGFMQFIPLVERAWGGEGLAQPPGRATAKAEKSLVTAWSVEAVAYGEFLCVIFDEWVRKDVGRAFVQIFDVMLGIWMGMPASLCVFAETCGGAMALEHNGDLYACDHYVYPDYRLGNIMESDMRGLADSEQQRRFGQDKRDPLPKYCRECDVRFACNGECPKHRFMTTPEGEDGLNYLCAGYKRFLHHIDRHMTAMGHFLRQGRPAADIMGMIAAEQEAKQTQVKGKVGRNDPCPCGSGKKHKKCCGTGG
jgi:uncharacterized protein